MALFHLDGVVGELDVYEERIVIKRKGKRAVKIYGIEEERSIPMEVIKGVKFRAWTLMVRGYLQFNIEGNIDTQGGFVAAASDENTIFFTKEGNETAKKIKNYIEEIIVKSTKYDDGNGSINELKRFKELFDEGIITKEEFEAKKKQILNL